MISGRIGEIIKKRREELGKGQKEISDLAGISQGYLSDLENGKIKNPTIETLLNIAKALDIRGEDLISEKEGFDKLVIMGEGDVLLNINDLPEDARKFAIDIINNIKNQYINKK